MALNLKVFPCYFKPRIKRAGKQQANILPGRTNTGIDVKLKKVIALAALLVLIPLSAPAEQKLNYWPYQEKNLSVSAEYFQWKEYLKDGTELLSESGPRWGLGIREHNYGRRLYGVVYEIDMRLYFGTVNYDGKSQDGSGNFFNVNTKTDYKGGRLLVMGGQRLTHPSLDMLAGMEVNSWIRSLIGATDSGGNYASGYHEMYRVLTARAALGTLQTFAGKPVYIQGGAKYPLDIFEYATVDTVRLTPKPALAFFGSVDIMKFWPSTLVKGSLKVFYEGYRFNASEVVNNYYQPESRMDTVGISLQF